MTYKVGRDAKILELRRYEYYKDLHYRGVLYDPQF